MVTDGSEVGMAVVSVNERTTAEISVGTIKTFRSPQISEKGGSFVLKKMALFQ